MSRGRLVVVALALLVLVACTDRSPSGEQDRRYVALGDSYVSGPGIPVQDAAAPVCVRSDQNYPQLVARDLERTTLVDVSCGGANTSTVREGRDNELGNRIPPQLDAVTPETDLVTIGIGGNDEALTISLFTQCLAEASAAEDECRSLAQDRAPEIYPATRDRVAATLAQIKERAPQARVILVGYLRIVPDAGECSALPITEANRAAGMEIEVALTEALEDAARAADVDFVDVRGTSEGHDVCAGEDAWVTGIKRVPDDGALLHPNKAGMRAVAEEVAKAIG